jgi:predicted aspartyl protease
MGTFHQRVEVGDLEGRHFEAIDAMVYTGSTYTFLPRDLLARLGVTPDEERPFILAKGQRVSYGMAWIRIRMDGREQPTPVIFGEEASEPLLGAVTLDEFGLAVDSLNRRLVTTLRISR